MPVQNIRRIVRLAANPGAGETMRKALIALRAETMKEAGCVEFEFLQSLINADAFVLIEDFQSAEALEVHMRAPHTLRFFELKLMASGQPIDKLWLS